MTDSTWFLVIAIVAIALQALTIFVALFEPSLKYRITQAPSHPLESERFRQLLAALADSEMNSGTSVEVLKNGNVFYEAELDAIRRATKSINIEAYIFQRGELTRRFVSALAERARAGVKVNMVLDGIGCFTTPRSYFYELQSVGGCIEWYHPIRWYTLPRINNRTHRELIIIDGEIGFVGGAGFADQWYKSTKKVPQWRDTMFRVKGKAVTAMQAAFLENWLEASGEMLTEDAYFCFPEVREQSQVMIVDSTPSAGESTRGRMLFQVLLASATKSIRITTPYFLPDHSVREEIICAVRDRGVDVRIITPGQHNDHLLTRRSSRRLYGSLLKAGARIFEYQPSMIHTKSLVIDDLWCAVGSTNFDHRSFSINDEVNLASSDERMASELNAHFAEDVLRCEEVSYDQWVHRPIWERMHEGLGWILERQE